MPENNDSQFENPPDEGPDSAGATAFDDPSSAEDDAVSEALAAAPNAVREARAALESKVEAQAAQLEGAADVQAFIEAGNLQGVGIGLSDGDSGGAPGEAALVLYVAEPTSPEAASQVVAQAMGVSAEAAAEVPVNVQVTGIIDAQPHRFRMRPAPGGISVGHFKITAGTIGCLVRGRTAPRNSRVMILSNNHVLANTNNAAINDCICQPGPADGGKCPADQVAVLESFVRIVMGGATNYVDCATGWAWHERVRKELVYLSGGAPQYFGVSSAPTQPVVGMTVGKTGRTTQLQQGRITAVGVAVNVNYGASGVAHFKDQMSITKPGGGNFSQGGDSGSLIWQWDNARRPVGLLFAGGGTTTFANRITRVLDALAVNVYT